MHVYLIQRDQVIELLQQMGVVVGQGLYYSWQVSADLEVLTVYLTDDPQTAIVTASVVDLAPIIPAAPLPAPPGLSVTRCLPTGAALSDPNLTLRVQGAQFTPTTVILFNGGVEPTTYVSAKELVTIVQPSTAAGAGAVPIQVQDGPTILPPDPSPITFTFTAA